MNEKSYTEPKKSGAMKREKAKELWLQEMYIEMLLNEIQLNLEKAKLMTRIDEALEKRNKKAFLDLSGSLSELNRRFGA